MEHRWSARVPTTTKVIVFHNKIPVALCRTNVIGLGGMFIETGPITYSRNTKLEVEFELATDNGTRLFHLSVCVVRGLAEGMGLMFLDSNSELTQTIRKMLINGISHSTPSQQIGLAPIPAPT